jgi:hypothetical protein
MCRAVSVPGRNRRATGKGTGDRRGRQCASRPRQPTPASACVAPPRRNPAGTKAESAREQHSMPGHPTVHEDFAQEEERDPVEDHHRQGPRKAAPEEDVDPARAAPGPRCARGDGRRERTRRLRRRRVPSRPGLDHVEPLRAVRRGQAVARQRRPGQILVGNEIETSSSIDPGGRGSEPGADPALAIKEQRRARRSSRGRSFRVRGRTAHRHLAYSNPSRSGG